MVRLFLLNILKNNLEKRRQGNVYLVFYSDNKYLNGSSKQTSQLKIILAAAVFRIS